MLIYPAIDLLNGKVVRLSKGDYDQVSTYSDDPTEIAKQLEIDGAEWIHIVDLDGAKQGSSTNLASIKSICESTSVKIQVGGGIRSMQDAETMLTTGISRLIIGTTALKQPDVLASMVEAFGSEKVIVSVDIKNGVPASEGWLESSDTTSPNVAELLNNIGVKKVVVTDVSKDGMLQGPNIALVKEWIGYGFSVIAAGGVSTAEDIAALNRIGAEGAIIGKALYEGKITLNKALIAARPNGLTNRIIACMDIKDGRVVKGTGFKNFVDNGDPVELSKLYSQQKADELVLLDIAATNEARKNRIELVAEIARQINIPFTIGGGISEISDIGDLLQAGADKVSIGTAAIKNPDFVNNAVSEFGGQAIVISIDVKREEDDWKIYTYGNMKSTGLNAIEFARDMESRGAGELLVNSLDRDGTKSGYDIEILNAISDAVGIPVIASSGVGRLEDFKEVFEETQVTAALGARVFHTNQLGIVEVKRYLKDEGIRVRL